MTHSSKDGCEMKLWQMESKLPVVTRWSCPWSKRSWHLLLDTSSSGAHQMAGSNHGLCGLHNTNQQSHDYVRNSARYCCHGYTVTSELWDVFATSELAFSTFSGSGPSIGMCAMFLMFFGVCWVFWKVLEGWEVSKLANTSSTPSIDTSSGCKAWFLSKYISRSMLTFLFLGQQIQNPLDSLSKPTKRVSSAFGSNFPVSSCVTQTIAPHSQSCDKSGFSSIATSWGVFSSGRARVSARFHSQTSWCPASAHKLQGGPAVIIIAQALFMWVLFSCSTAPFEAGESWTVRWWTVPPFLRWLLNSLLVSSAVWSHPNILIHALHWASAYASYFL